MARRFNERTLFYIQLLAIATLTALAVGIPNLDQRVPCPTTFPGFELSYSGEFRCLSRGWLQPQTTIQFADSGSESSNELKVTFLAAGNHTFNAIFQGLGKNSHFAMYGDRAEPPLASSSGVGTAWSVLNRTSFDLSLPSTVRDLTVVQQQNGQTLEMTVPIVATPTEAIDKVVGQRRILRETDTQYLSFTLALLIFGISAGLFLRGPSSTKNHLWFITTIFFLSTFYGGIPFGSNAGWIDTGDDRSYFHWAYNLGYLLDPFLNKDVIPSWAALFNVHSWGSGLLLGLPLPLLRSVTHGSLQANSTLLYIAMSATSIFLSYFAIVIYYFAFSHVLSGRIAAFCAVLTLVSTSLLKWTFMRNIFTHSPEAFCLATMTYCLLTAYKVPARRQSLLFGFLAVGVLATQVRREDVLFLFLPVALQGIFWTKQSEWLLTFAKCAFAAVLSIAILRGTNYLVGLDDFWKEPTGNLLHLYEAGAYFRKNAYNIVFGADFGLLAWWNAPAWIALILCFTLRRHRQIAAILGLYVIGYVAMCIIHGYPNGDEWQNRFLIKLNPIIFLGTGLMLQRLRHPGAQTLVSGLLVMTGLYEWNQYRKQLPLGMTFYSDFVTDSQVTLARLAKMESSLFFLPLVAIALLTIVIGFAANRKTRRALR